MESISGFSNLQAIHGRLHIVTTHLPYFQNPDLSKPCNIEGFVELKTVGKDFWIFDTTVRELNGFRKLKTIGGYFRIIANSLLEVVDGFTSLETIGARMEIDNNKVLYDISGLTYLSFVGTVFSVSNNDRLPSEPIFTLIDQINEADGIQGSIKHCSNLEDVSCE